MLKQNTLSYPPDIAIKRDDQENEVNKTKEKTYRINKIIDYVEAISKFLLN